MPEEPSLLDLNQSDDELTPIGGSPEPPKVEVKPEIPIQPEPLKPEVPIKPEPEVNAPLDQKPAKPKSKLWLVILIIIIVLAGLGAAYYYFFYNATFIISVDPTSAKVDLTGPATYSNVGDSTVKLKPGQYDLKVTLTNYVDFEESITLKPSRKTSLSVKLNRLPEVVKIVDYPAKYVTSSADEKSLLYLSNEGRVIYKIDDILTDTKQTPYAVTPIAFSSVENIFWHPAKDKMIVKMSGKTYLYDFKKYDVINQDKVEWPSGIGNLAWSPDGEKIAYFYRPSDQEKTLIRANKDNSGMERIYNLKDVNISNPQIYWSADGKKIILVDDSLYILDVYTKTLEQLKQFSTITDAQFTPDSQNIIFEREGGLYFTGLDGKDLIDLGIATNLNKTAWFDQNNLVYFIKSGDTDQLFIYNINTKAKTQLIYDPKYTINATNLIVSQDKTKIFFNQGDYLYSLKFVKKEY